MMLRTDILLTSDKEGYLFKVKVQDDQIFHVFDVPMKSTPGDVIKYQVTTLQGDPIVPAEAVVAHIEIFDNVIKGLIVCTEYYTFEVVKDRNYNFMAAKRMR